MARGLAFKIEGKGLQEGRVHGQQGLELRISILLGPKVGVYICAAD